MIFDGGKSKTWSLNLSTVSSGDDGAGAGRSDGGGDGDDDCGGGDGGGDCCL